MRNIRSLVLGLVLVSLAGVSWGDCVEGDCFNGKGKYTWPNGDIYDIYEGEWEYGLISGKGKYSDAHGNVYEGDWKAGNRSGKGKQTSADGYVYEGDWKAGKKTGKGKQTWADGSFYEGDWKEGAPNGNGKYTGLDGRVYEGGFKDWQFHGKGKATKANGNVVDGVFKDGEYLGTVADVEKKEKQRLAELERERLAKAEAEARYERIFNACLLDKSSGLDMQVKSIEAAVNATCETIAEDPSWLESLQYD